MGYVDPLQEVVAVARIRQQYDFAHPMPASNQAAQRCENCGLLAVFRIGERDWVPAEEAFRREGVRPARGAMLYDVGALCAGNRRDFKYPANSWETWTSEDWIWKLREDQTACASFVRWVPGLSIRDHKEMLDHAFMMKREDERDEVVRKREDERDEAQQQWQMNLAAMQHNLAVDIAQATWQHEDARSRRELWIIGGVVTAVIVAATLLGSVIQAGWIPNPRGDATGQPAVTATPVQIRTQ